MMGCEGSAYPNFSRFPLRVALRAAARDRNSSCSRLSSISREMASPIFSSSISIRSISSGIAAAPSPAGSGIPRSG